MSVWGERLDAAADGPAFGAALGDLFKSLEAAMGDDDE